MRDSAIDVLKGIGIILMVVGHSSPPKCVHDFIYAFHMPLFFIASGWFFNEVCLDNKKKYLWRKISGLYLPYLKWSFIFLMLHNVFYYYGIINSSYGYQGSVEKWYHFKDIIYHLVNILFRMTGYDNLIGTFWFMRSLFVGSLALCVVSSVVERTTKRKKFDCIIFVSCVSCIIGGLFSWLGIKIPLFPQGGYRELMTVYFLGVGCLMGKTKTWQSFGWLIGSCLILVVAIVIHPTALKTNPALCDWGIIVLSGTAGTIVTFKISKYISSYETKLKKSLVYVGKRTFYIMTFHFLMFKPASLLKAYLYDMDWQVIGYHPVIPSDGDMWFWLVYAVSSLFLSLMLERIVTTVPTPKILSGLKSNFLNIKGTQNGMIW